MTRGRRRLRILILLLPPPAAGLARSGATLAMRRRAVREFAVFHLLRGPFLECSHLSRYTSKRHLMRAPGCCCSSFVRAYTGCALVKAHQELGGHVASRRRPPFPLHLPCDLQVVKHEKSQRGGFPPLLGSFSAVIAKRSCGYRCSGEARRVASHRVDRAMMRCWSLSMGYSSGLGPRRRVSRLSR